MNLHRKFDSQYIVDGEINVFSSCKDLGLSSLFPAASNTLDNIPSIE